MSIVTHLILATSLLMPVSAAALPQTCTDCDGNGVPEADEVGDGERLRARARVDSLRPRAGTAEDGTQLLAPLGEERVHELAELFGLVVWDHRVGSRTQRQHRTRHFWRRPEAARRQHRDLLHLAERLHHDRERSVLARVRLCAQAITHLALDGHELTAALRQGCADRHHRTRSLIRQVRHQREGPSTEHRERVGVERTLAVEAVALHEREAGIRREVLTQVRGEVPIELDRHQLGAAREDLLAHRARAGADLDHERSLADAAGVDELSEQVVVDEEVLPEAVLGRESARGEDGSDVRLRLHAAHRTGKKQRTRRAVGSVGLSYPPVDRVPRSPSIHRSGGVRCTTDRSRR